MIFSLAVCAIVGILVFSSVLFWPEVRIFGRRIGTYWLISSIGALVLLASPDVSFACVAEELFTDSGVNPIQILVLFFSMTSISVFLDELGLFRYLAAVALRKTGNRQISLFLALLLVVSVLTVFTSNDVVVLTFTPFICMFAKNAGINPFPYLVAEFVAANTWSLLFIIGNPTNIYLAGSAGIDFVSYFRVMLLPTAVAGAVSFLLLFLLFRKELGKPICVRPVEVHLEERACLTVGVFVLLICTLLLALGSYINLPMYAIAFFSAMLLFLTVFGLDICRKHSLRPLGRTAMRLPYELIPFVLSMFILVSALNKTGAAAFLAGLLQKGDGIFTVGISSFFMANVINNIPMSVLFSSLLENGAGGLDGVYAAVIGSNLGAYFTPVGALAGMMWSAIINRYQIQFPFKKFISYGTVISIPTLLAALFCLSLVLG